LKKKWVKLNLFYIGQSAKKHQIFRVKPWYNDLERILKQPIYDENYKVIGLVKDIFGPINMPFVSIKTLPNSQFDPKLKFYTKLP
jgi:rRNA processing protein Gar1